jgi:hypothetical protein
MTLRYKLKLGALVTGRKWSTDDDPDATAHEMAAGTRQIFVGFKNSLEALSRYDIYVNSNKIYSQSWVGPESFIYNAGISQNVREKNPYVYTTWKKVAERSHDVCGVYVNFDNDADIDAGKEFEVEIPVKINLHQILMLSSVKYLPSFCGRWEIELYPNWNNLVVAAVPLSRTLKNSPKTIAQSFGHDNFFTCTTAGFVQIGKKFNMVGRVDNLTPFDITPINNQFLTVTEGTLEQCLISITTFQLRYEVFEGLRQMYAEQPLIIPTNILNYGRFSGEPGANTDGTIFHATLSQSLENVDSIFILVPFMSDQTTCFYQPYLRELRLSLGEFGTHPARYVQTFDDPRFLAMCLDALNLESSEITGMNEDVQRSLVNERKFWTVTAADVSAAQYSKLASGDPSNFFIGISLSQIGFQSGTVSSPNTNVPFIFDATLDRTQNRATEKIDTSIIVMFLIDAALMIQVIPDSDVPVVKLTSKSIV